ncbi:hypothetical protein F8388_004891 [Cannabis sativa]|uniref:Lysosomal Pro-X carboxypeptidase n=1 Tax=Cannabis sativa TaxID=3483 RepID=A0A7J6HNV9_CANSA|nr:hypothetical protein F8388_004891 [Cannabis sativa]
MAIGISFQWLFLLCLVSSVPFSLSRITPRFPSSLISPEKVSVSTTTKLYKTSYFTQTLDHFNFLPQSYQTFQQRYLINDTFWGGAKTKAPIFVYTGNEGEIEWFAQNTGFMFETAPHFKALLVFLEHRFYGKSIPFGGDKEVAYSNTSTLGYLSSTQALADYATLIIDLKNNISASESENCYQVIKESWQQIKDTAKTSKGINLLRKSFKLCKNYEYIGDYLESWLSTAFVYTAMTDYPTPSNFLNPLPAYPVKQMCKAIDNPKSGRNSNTFEKVYGAANIYYNYSGTATCFDLEDNSDPHGLSEWSWQACTEIILPTGGSTNESIFPAYEWHYSDRASSCQRAFGIHPRRTWITTHFGGFNISETIVAIVAKEGAHHVDLRFSTKEDPEWLKEVRKQEVRIIEGWISQYYHDLAHLSF